MTQEEINQNASTMVGIYCAIGHAFGKCQPPMQLSEDTLKSLTATIYIQATKPQKKAGGSYKSSSGGGSFKPPTGEHGYCSDCQEPNAYNPKTGKTFCSAKCWTN